MNNRLADVEFENRLKDVEFKTPKVNRLDGIAFEEKPISDPQDVTVAPEMKLFPKTEKRTWDSLTQSPKPQMPDSSQY